MLILFFLAIFAVVVIGGRKTLKPLFHLLSLLLVLPSFLFAGACLFLHQTTSRGLFVFLNAIVNFLDVMMPWGLTVLVVCFGVLAAGGFRPASRRLAAGILAAIALGSAGVIVCATGWPEEEGQWWFFLPDALSLLISAWLLCARETGAREFAFDYPGGLRIDRQLGEAALGQFRGGARYEVRETGGGWRWVHLPAFQDGALRMSIVLGFNQGALKQIDLYHDDPAVYPENWEHGSDDLERRRAATTRAWLQRKGFRVGSHLWGEIWSSWDARLAFGGVGIRYAVLPDSGARAGLLESGAGTRRLSTV